MATKIELRFFSPVEEFDDISVKFDVGGGVYMTAEETFVTQRSGYGYSSIGTITGSGDDVLRIAENFTTAWNLDHKDKGGTDNLVAVADGALVTITVKDTTWQIDSAFGSAVDDGEIQVTITNDTPTEPLSMNITGWAGNAGDPCGSADATISMSGGTSPYDLYIDGVPHYGLTSPATLTFPRGQSVLLTGQDADGNRLPRKTVTAARKLIASDISVTLENYSSGTTITITNSYPFSDPKPFTYSIGGAFQESNVFSGIAPGTYTLTIRDAWGCELQQSLVVDGVTEVAETVFSISEINPLRYARYQPGVKKNYQNTLSCHELKQIARPYVHTYLESDVITTQLKTNAQYLRAYTMDPDGITHDLSLIQKSENTGLKAKSTCTYYDLGGGRSAVYFGVVDKLDYTTDAVIETVDYGFTVPEWANEKGKLVTLEGVGQIRIAEIGYSESYEAFILIFDIAYTGSPVTRKISAEYNIQPYEVFEFETRMNAEPELFNVIVEAGTSSDNIEFTHVSEKVKRVEDSEFLFEINYWDSRNKGEMVYKTGVKHKMRLKGFIDYKGEQKTEGYNGDSQYYVTDNEVYHSEKFVFTNLSTEMAHKLRLVMSHDNLIINNIAYKIAEVPEINEGFSYNMRHFSVVLKSGGELFLDSDHEIISGSEVEDEILTSAIEASRGKSLLLWTKVNG